ncbi:hypothetical protein SynWH8103_00718 [Synechococcus sp. WH 8103]|nr:hypothetical protein SynWH8103_00718 [Synechococcus sp. WH 8103]
MSESLLNPRQPVLSLSFFTTEVRSRGDGLTEPSKLVWILSDRPVFAVVCRLTIRE